MAKKLQDQTTIDFLLQDDLLSKWAESFLIDRKAKGLSPHSTRFYKVELTLFLRYCDGQVLSRIEQLTPDILRRYLLYLEENGRNPGGVHAAFRALRAFLLWYENETEPEGWKNPIRKVKAPRVAEEPIDPVSIETVKELIAACSGPNGLRDKALLLFLLDTGARASEVCAVDLADIDLISGGVLIRSGKGGKPRTVFIGKKTKMAIRAYLKKRGDQHPALWTTDDGDRLTYYGLNQIVRRRARDAGVPKPELHSFRRAFALNFLRNGGDLMSLQRLMGHADLQVLRRYLAQTTQDLQVAHGKNGPVDRNL